MKINYLKEFITLSEIGNFQLAAEMLFFSQPTLTRHIKLLEEALGVPVFDRTTRKIELNEYGRLLLPYAKEIVRLYDEVNDVVEYRQRSSRSLVTIGSIPSLASYSITKILETYQQQYPQHSIRVVEDGSTALIHLLEKELCDFAFVRRFHSDTAGTDEEFVSLPLCSDRIIVFLSSQHPLAKEKTLSISQFRNENLFLPKGDRLYNKLVSAFSQAGFQPNISFIGSRTEDVVDMVKRGMGIAFTLSSSTRFLPKDGISLHELDQDFSMDINLTYIKDRRMSAPALSFLQSVRMWISAHPESVEPYSE